jgi:hypothetical protein
MDSGAAGIPENVAHKMHIICRRLAILTISRNTRKRQDYVHG